MEENGELDQLLSEGRAVQKRVSRKKKTVAGRKEKRFIQLMEAGKVSAALRCIGSLDTDVLQPSAEVLEELKLKHPPPKVPDVRALIQGPLPKVSVEQVIYEHIDAGKIFHAAKHVNGAAGPSSADSDLWIGLLCSKQLKRKPAELCQSLAEVTRKLNTERVQPSCLRRLVAGRLIPLWIKNQGFGQ